MRATHDAVMVGIGTALADDPDLTVRDLGVAHQPVRVVLDSRARLPADGRLARSARAVPVWLCHGDGAAVPRALTDAGVRPIACATGPDGRIDMGDALHRLGDAGLTRVFCEGGAGVAAALLAGGHVTDIAAFSAGRVFGADGTPGVGALIALPVLPDPAEFRLIGAEPVGGDLLHLWRRRTAAG